LHAQTPLEMLCGCKLRVREVPDEARLEEQR